MFYGVKLVNEGQLRKAITRYVKKCYETDKKVPSIREICKRFRKENLGPRRFYEIFPGRVREVCKLAGVPVPKERVKRTAEATKVSKGRMQVEKDLSEVEDEQVRRKLADTLKWEIRGDKAEARLKAEERRKKAKLRALKNEAELDSKNIPAYLEALDEPHLNRVLNYMRQACKFEKISLKAGCVKAVEGWGSRGPAKKETFKRYIERCLDGWAELPRLKATWVKYEKTTFDSLCPKCHVKYAYIERNPDEFRCTKCLGYYHFSCPVCRELYSSEEHLEYYPESDMLSCPRCAMAFNVRPSALDEYNAFS